MQKITFKKTIGHLKTILIHKWWVFYYACKLGIPWRGIKHDMSKFSPVEFWESVRYWSGTKSPIPVCKEIQGYSLAWQHHKGRNSHHYEYWVDALDRGGVAIKMPWKDLLELVADYLGAARAYLGKDFSLQKEADWWFYKRRENIKMHEESQDAVTIMFGTFAIYNLVFVQPGWEEAYKDGNLRVYDDLS